MSIQAEMVVYHQSSRAYFPMASWLAFKDAEATHVALPLAGLAELVVEALISTVEMPLMVDRRDAVVRALLAAAA